MGGHNKDAFSRFDRFWRIFFVKSYLLYFSVDWVSVDILVESYTIQRNEVKSQDLIPKKQKFENSKVWRELREIRHDRTYLRCVIGKIGNVWFWHADFVFGDLIL